MSECCEKSKTVVTSSCCDDGGGHNDHNHSKSFDWLLWGSAFFVIVPFLLAISGLPIFADITAFQTYIHSIHEFVAMSWWGVVIGIFFLALLSKIPREFVMSVLGKDKGSMGILRAMAAGVLLDLCNHGILMIGAKIYQRGASIGQVMAFLIASPWNSLSLTIILISMIGLKLTLIFIVLSCVIAFITGLIFDYLVKRGTLPQNPNAFNMPDGFKFWPETKVQLSKVKWTQSFVLDMAKSGLTDSRMVLRWLLFGIVIASLLRVFFTPESFAQYFGPTLLGMAATVLFATILEVCSEGSSPIASDFVSRANAPGNAFAFLMAGASTDYTEIMVMRDVTKSWKIALFLPLITLPQIILLGILLNF